MEVQSPRPLQIMKVNYTTNNVFLISGYSEKCNKFVEYCLGLSKYFFLGENYTFKHLMPRLDDYQYRLQFCKSRLPPSESEKNIRINRFIGVPSHFYLNAPDFWQQGSVTDEVSEEFATLTNMNLKFCLNVYGQSQECLNYHTVWPNAKVVRVVNIDGKISDGNEHKEHYQEIAGISWPSWEEMHSNNFVIDRCTVSDDIKTEISSIYQWNKLTCPVYEFDFSRATSDVDQFCNEMTKLYQFAEVDDFNENNLRDYYQCSLDTFLNSTYF